MWFIPRDWEEWNRPGEQEKEGIEADKRDWSVHSWVIQITQEGTNVLTNGLYLP